MFFRMGISSKLHLAYMSNSWLQKDQILSIVLNLDSEATTGDSSTFSIVWLVEKMISFFFYINWIKSQYLHNIAFICEGSSSLNTSRLNTSSFLRSVGKTKKRRFRINPFYKSYILTRLLNLLLARVLPAHAISTFQESRFGTRGIFNIKNIFEMIWANKSEGSSENRCHNLLRQQYRNLGKWETNAGIRKVKVLQVV